MKTFKSFIRRKPGAGFEGTNEVRKDHISKTPYQKDPITNEKPTPHLEEGNDPYDWDTNYGKRFRLAITPKDQSGGEQRVSIVTPPNGDAWHKWEEAPEEVKSNFRKNWGNIQKSLAPHKRRQIETGQL